MEKFKCNVFDIDTILVIDSKVWIVDKTKPNIPILKISEYEFNLIKDGIYKSQDNKIYFNGKVYWLPTTLYNNIKIHAKNYKADLNNLGISIQEFLNKDIIDNTNYELRIDLLNKLLKNKTDDNYIICSKLTKRNYESIIEKVEKKLNEEGIIIKKFIFINETFYDKDADFVHYKKIEFLLRLLTGYKIQDKKFIDKQNKQYSVVNFYDIDLGTLSIYNDINNYLKSILSKTDNGLKEVIKENIDLIKPLLEINQLTTNKHNQIISKSVYLDYSNLFKTFESFNKR
jgi:hypothetical protein